MTESSTSMYVERTLALIKPDVVHLSEEIEEVILASGFTILQVGTVVTGYTITKRELAQEIDGFRIFYVLCGSSIMLRFGVQQTCIYIFNIISPRGGSCS